MAKMKKNTPERFTALSNTIVRDDSLSWKARGIFLYLFSQSDDWDFYETEVANHATDGRNSLRSGLKELEEKGYIQRERVRNEKGQLMSSNWLLSDQPMSQKLMLQKPMYDNRTLDSSTLSNTNLSNTNKSNTNNKNTPRLLSDNTSIVSTEENEKKVVALQSNTEITTSNENDFKTAYRSIVSIFENNGFGSVGGIIQQSITAELNDFSKQSNISEAYNLISKAIEISVNNNKNTFAYVWGITKRWYDSGIFTIEAYEAEEKKKNFNKKFGGEVKKEKLKNGGYGTR